MRISALLAVVAVAAGQLRAEAKPTVPIDEACVALNDAVLKDAKNGRLAEAETALSSALVADTGVSRSWCTGVILNNLAAVMSMSGQLAKAEKFAERSVAVLEKSFPPGDPVFLHPLQILVTARYRQGEPGRAMEALRKLQSIRTGTAEDRALVSGTAGMLLYVTGRYGEAEAAYLAALRAWDEAGQGNSKQSAAILNSLASLYLQQKRLEDAGRVLDRVAGILNGAGDTAPVDRIKLSYTRGVLHTWQGRWPEAENDLRDALAEADRQGWVDQAWLRSLLVNYAQALRKNHHGSEARAAQARADAISPDRGSAWAVDVAALQNPKKRN